MVQPGVAWRASKRRADECTNGGADDHGADRGQERRQRLEAEASCPRHQSGDECHEADRQVERDRLARRVPQGAGEDRQAKFRPAKPDEAAEDGDRDREGKGERLHVRADRSRESPGLGRGLRCRRRPRERRSVWSGREELARHYPTVGPDREREPELRSVGAACLSAGSSCDHPWTGPGRNRVRPLPTVPTPDRSHKCPTAGSRG